MNLHRWIILRDHFWVIGSFPFSLEIRNRAFQCCAHDLIAKPQFSIFTFALGQRWTASTLLPSTWIASTWFGPTLILPHIDPLFDLSHLMGNEGHFASLDHFPRSNTPFFKLGFSEASRLRNRKGQYRYFCGSLPDFQFPDALRPDSTDLMCIDPITSWPLDPAHRPMLTFWCLWLCLWPTFLDLTSQSNVYHQIRTAIRYVPSDAFTLLAVPLVQILEIVAWYVIRPLTPNLQTSSSENMLRAPLLLRVLISWIWA